jgi:hypothetical protein
MTLIEKDYESEYNGEWKRVEGAPDFDSVEAAKAWLQSHGVVFFDRFRLI